LLLPFFSSVMGWEPTPLNSSQHPAPFGDHAQNSGL
jgi:hypothetical protein